MLRLVCLIVCLLPITVHSELFFVPGGISYHFDRSRDLNEVHPGAGFKYSSSDLDVLALTFIDSFDQRGLLINVTPIKLSHVNIGVSYVDKYFKPDNKERLLLPLVELNINVNNRIRFTIIPVPPLTFNHRYYVTKGLVFSYMEIKI